MGQLLDESAGLSQRASVMLLQPGWACGSMSVCLCVQQLKETMTCACEYARSDHAGPTRDRTMGSEGLAGRQPMWDLDTAETTDSKKNVAALNSRWLSCTR